MKGSTALVAMPTCDGRREADILLRSATSIAECALRYRIIPDGSDILPPTATPGASGYDFYVTYNNLVGTWQTSTPPLADRYAVHCSPNPPRRSLRSGFAQCDALLHTGARVPLLFRRWRAA